MEGLPELVSEVYVAITHNPFGEPKEAVPVLEEAVGGRFRIISNPARHKDRKSVV